jgi:hypothetical protein
MTDLEAFQKLPPAWIDPVIKCMRERASASSPFDTGFTKGILVLLIAAALKRNQRRHSIG